MMHRGVRAVVSVGAVHESPLGARFQVMMGVGGTLLFGPLLEEGAEEGL
jgi:hypothetical protein